MNAAWPAGAIVAFLLPSFASAPTPPTIIHERVSPVCTALHDLVIPLARMQAQYRSRLAHIALQEQQEAKYRDDRVPTTMFAFSIDTDAANIIGQIHQIELLLIASYRASPQGKNPKVDALRQRVQNVVDLERATANKYASVYGAIVDNAGLDMLSSDPGFGPAQTTPTPWPEMTSLPTTPPAASPQRFQADVDPRIDSTPPPGVRSRVLKFFSSSQLKAGLESEGHALTQQALVAARDCDGG